eukprot:TRINITY_DN3558_c0_g1_i3.p1 TRINITY_DN3558_c0_g1~~TRINITY_DN3558_c0_g1_i3.p1  ORF type:complete len:484 (+),score=74.69 TRINITY_DN3558_c0_g1_i3:59-1453(+)
MTDSAIAAPPSDHTLLNASIIQAAASLIGCGNAVAIARLISRTPIPAGDGLLSHLALGGAGHFRQPPIPLLAAALEHFQQLVRLRSDQLLEKEDALKLLIDAVHLYQRNTRLLLAPAIGKIKPALESDLIAVALRYHSVVAQEEKQVEQELEAESIACKRQSEQLTAALYFGLFGAHVERETASAVKFRKLQPSNPMFVRCKQAAIGNVKDGFFTGSAVTGLDVVDVFKIDNKPARARFHQVASMFEPSQTKGLFSLIPVNSIERLVVLGVGAPGMDRADVFPPHWSSSGTEDESYVDGVLKQCRMLPMPLVCSRYSTLEHGRPSARPTSVASSRRMSEADLDANAGRDFHYLILSRVVLGNVCTVLMLCYLTNHLHLLLYRWRLWKMLLQMFFVDTIVRTVLLQRSITRLISGMCCLSFYCSVGMSLPRIVTGKQCHTDCHSAPLLTIVIEPFVLQMSKQQLH